MSSECWRDRIACDPDLMHGEPCIKGTRIPVAILVASLADMSRQEVLAAYPQLAWEDIQAALLYAAESAKNTLVA